MQTPPIGRIANACSLSAITALGAITRMRSKGHMRGTNSNSMDMSVMTVRG